MSNFVLSVESLFDGSDTSDLKTIVVENGLITKIDNCTFSEKNILSGTLLPGFIDIQVNGGGGYQFNKSPDLKTIIKIGRAHQTFGTCGWLPTLTSDSLEKMQSAADAVAAARALAVPGVLGIHFEGPHLSLSKKGIHPETFIRQLSNAERHLYLRSDLGKVMVTLAPEMVAPQCITELVDAGVIVCLGHSNASYEQTLSALDAGATGFTHLFNAMSAFTSREPGMVGAALLDKNSYSGLILDGIHVHPSTAKLAINSQKNIMLVTDAMSPVGSDQSSFDFFGQLIKRNENSLINSQGRLAGSMLNMATAVKNCVEMLGISLQQAINLASKNPAGFLGLRQEYGSLEVGKKASMILLNKKGDVLACWIDGNEVFKLV